jgi:stage II sporulation protein D
MNRRALAVLIFVATALPARPASSEFRIALFSRSAVKNLTIEAGRQSANLCGLRSDGPCEPLGPNQKAVCYAGRLVHCQFAAASRDFTALTISSAGPFRLTPWFSGANESPQTFLARQISVSVRQAGLRVIVKVDLDSYVSGVLGGEASTLKAPAARAAMAILARTWALRWQGRHRAQGFDFCSLTHCQVFRLPRVGQTNAADHPDEATAETHGKVLTYGGDLADPYFTACCGGMTEAAGNVWPDRAQPYLIAIRDPYCLASEHAVWQRVLSIESVRRVLRTDLHFPLTAPLTEFSVAKRDSSGRALRLRVVSGSAWQVDANEFRYALDRRQGWGQIKSNLYSLQRRGDSWVFSGHGLGHGVGLCQAGAEQMGRMGFSAEKILDFYFPGTTVSSQPSVEPDPIASSEHFELAYPSSQEPWVKQTLETLERWRRELGSHAEALPSRVRVRTWASTEEFIRATGQPGWTAAASEGQSIALQPLDLLARKRILYQTLRHELTHLVAHRLCAPGVPRWFEEGLVLYTTGERIAGGTAALPSSSFPPNSSSTAARERESDAMTELQLERAITKPRSAAEMKAAYAQALERVRRLARHRGDETLWQVLEHPSAEDFRWLHKGE